MNKEWLQNLSLPFLSWQRRAEPSKRTERPPTSNERSWRLSSMAKNLPSLRNAASWFSVAGATA